MIRPGLKDHLNKYLAENIRRFHLPLSLYAAIDQYVDWNRMNPLTSAAAREQTIIELMELFRLNSWPDLVRYCFYRHTYFMDSIPAIIGSFDSLLEKNAGEPGNPAYSADRIIGPAVVPIRGRR